MNINIKDEKPIFLQIKEWLETGILTHVYPEESQIPSTTEISVNYKINPATALKGINELVAENILYKKRGIGIFVKEGAVEIIKNKRQDDFKKVFLIPMLEEANRLNIDEKTLIKLIRDDFKGEYHGHN